MASPGAMGRTIPSREATRAGQRVGRAVAKEDGDSVTQWLSHCPTEHHRGGTRGCVERSHPGSPLAPSAVSPRRGPLSLEDSHLSCASPHVPAVHHLPERTRLRAVAPPHPKGTDPGAQRPSGHLPAPRHAPCSHPKFHTVRFSVPQPISCLCNKSPAGGRHVSSHAPPLQPSPTLPRLGALRAPRCASLGAPAPSRLRGDPEKRGSAPQHGKCSAAFQVSAPQLCPAEPLAAGRTCREPQFGRDESGAGGESGAGRTPERRGPAAPRLCSEHPLPRATAPPRARPRDAPRAGQRPRAGRHRVPAAVAQEMLAVPGEGSALLRSPARRLAAGRTPCSTRTPRSYFSLARLLDSGH